MGLSRDIQVGIWFGLVPLGIMSFRFFKPKPTTFGLPLITGKLDKRWLFWTIHYFSLYAAIGLSLIGIIIAIVVSKGFSGSVHSFLGLGAILLGCLQIFTAWLRGSHGGRNGAKADLEDSSTWHGDHYDMTTRRKWFEAYHRTAGYGAVVLALSAIATGFAQFWMPTLAIVLIVSLIGFLIACVIFEGKGFRQDTYRSVFGNHPENPNNKNRTEL